MYLAENATVVLSRCFAGPLEDIQAPTGGLQIFDDLSDGSHENGSGNLAPVKLLECVRIRM